MSILFVGVDGVVEKLEEEREERESDRGSEERPSDRGSSAASPPRRLGT